jgi:hypothetical protein
MEASAGLMMLPVTMIGVAVASGWDEEISLRRSPIPALVSAEETMALARAKANAIAATPVTSELRRPGRSRSSLKRMETRSASISLSHLTLILISMLT